MRTSIYIDGFNLFHGSLRRTPYRWLDLRTLVEHLLPNQSTIATIKYFTARVSNTPDNPSVTNRQNSYLCALKKHIPELEIHYGFFQKRKTEMRLVSPKNNELTAKVWKLEEKGSDVNLAVQLLNDAWLNTYDTAAIISNDSDLSEALALVKKLNKEIILITPNTKPGRGTSKKLLSLANHVRHIDKISLAKSQLPNPIPGTTIHKPVTW